MSYTADQMQAVVDMSDDFYKMGYDLAIRMSDDFYKMGYDLAIRYAELAQKYDKDIVTYLKENKPKEK